LRRFFTHLTHTTKRRANARTLTSSAREKGLHLGVYNPTVFGDVLDLSVVPDLLGSRSLCGGKEAHNILN
jgi:hypothetical protein